MRNLIFFVCLAALAVAIVNSAVAPTATAAKKHVVKKPACFRFKRVCKRFKKCFKATKCFKAKKCFRFRFVCKAKTTKPFYSCKNVRKAFK